MNIISVRQQKRQSQIGQITASINKVKAEGRELDKKQLLLVTMSELGLSRRTAQEYVDVALFNANE